MDAGTGWRSGQGGIQGARRWRQWQLGPGRLRGHIQNVFCEWMLDEPEVRWREDSRVGCAMRLQLRALRAPSTCPLQTWGQVDQPTPPAFYRGPAQTPTPALQARATTGVRPESQGRSLAWSPHRRPHMQAGRTSQGRPRTTGRTPLRSIQAHGP